MTKSTCLIALIFLLFFSCHSQEKIIIKFNYSYLDYEFIDDESTKTTKLEEIFKDEAEKELSKLESAFPKLRECDKDIWFSFY